MTRQSDDKNIHESLNRARGPYCRILYCPERPYEKSAERSVKKNGGTKVIHCKALRSCLLIEFAGLIKQKSLRLMTVFMETVRTRKTRPRKNQCCENAWIYIKTFLLQPEQIEMFQSTLFLKYSYMYNIKECLEREMSADNKVLSVFISFSQFF